MSFLVYAITDTQRYVTNLWLSCTEAVGNIISFLGMQPCERSDKVPENKNSHVLFLAGGCWMSGCHCLVFVKGFFHTNCILKKLNHLKFSLHEHKVFSRVTLWNERDVISYLQNYLKLCTIRLKNIFSHLDTFSIEHDNVKTHTLSKL